MTERTTVAILGGGIAGLTTAHELARNDRFEVSLFEQNSVLGGKARSVRDGDDNPGEHSLRVFPAEYASIYQTMTEVPYGDGTAYDNLTYGEFGFTLGEAEFRVSTEYQGFPRHVRDVFRLLRFFHRGGMTYPEIVCFVARISRIIWICPARQAKTMSSRSFSDYMSGEDRSDAFRRIVFTIPEILVAAKSTASAALICRTLLTWIAGPFLTSPFDRKGVATLNGPTSERFIEPMVSNLVAMGVEIHANTRVTKLRETGGRIAAFEKEDGSVIVADLYVIAVQHNMLRPFLTDLGLPSMVELELELEPLGEEWSFGAQYYLASIPEEWARFQGAITMPIDSPWSIAFTIYSNDGAWSGVPLPAGTAGVLSLAFSEVREVGVRHQKVFNQCTQEEILEECLVQCGLDGQPDAIRYGSLSPDLLYVPSDHFADHRDDYVGQAIAHLRDSDQVIVSDGLIFVRDPGNSALEPENATDIDNLFLVSCPGICCDIC